MTRVVSCGLIPAAILLMAVAVYAQQRARVEGRISASQVALSNVTVEVLSGDEVIASDISAEDGAFRIDILLPPQEALIQIRFRDPSFGIRTLDLKRPQRQASLSEENLNIVVELGFPAMAKPPAPPTGGRNGGATGQPPGGWVSTANENHAIVKVFYATDRALADTVSVQFGGERANNGKLSLGRVDVSVPRDHRMGTVERPTMWTFWREDPAKHFIVIKRIPHSYESFYGEVAAIVKTSQRKEAFVFVHGYNVAFDDAIYRTAQLTYDLGFDGAPILYSWPSVGSELGYAVDSNNAEWTTPHLRWFLEDVSVRTGAQVIHLIAHSMGNRPVVGALREMALAPLNGQRPHFRQVVLTAPDIDVDTFRQLASNLRGAADRITLYASSNDMALKLSKKYQGYQRLGDSVPDVVVLPEIDTIDVSNVETSLLGHSYYGDNKTVLTDIFALIKNGLAPSQRFGLRPAGQATRRWWIFAP